MPGKSRTFPRLLTGAASITAICIALLNSGPVQAQLAAPEKSPAATDPTRQPDDSAVPADIVVTGSRIDRAGFDAPTPMTVISQVELRQGGRTDLQAALGDMPQVRMTQSAVTTNSNTGSGQAPADLRGLGASRTLVLLNGHRFIASDDLQMIPFSLTRDVNVVTGGASAAWGSGAVAGVINVVLDDNITGLSLNAQSGISSRGDGAKQYFNVAYGANLTDRWHIMAGADYMRDRGVQPAMERPRIGATAFVRGTDGILRPTQDVVQADRSTGGLIKNGVLRAIRSTTMAPCDRSSSGAGSARPWLAAKAIVTISCVPSFRRSNAARCS